MTDLFFFVLGIINSLLLILIFILRKHRLDLIKKYNWIYLMLAIPTIVFIIIAVSEKAMIEYVVFLIIFFAFLLFEWLMDFIFKIEFRENFKTNLKWVIPYLCLYYAMNYGFVVMPWKLHLSWGLIMASLFIIQIALNLWSHPKQKN